MVSTCNCVLKHANTISLHHEPLTVVTQDVHHQAQAGQEAETESTRPSVGPDEDGEHHSIQRKEATLATNKTQTVSPGLLLLGQRRMPEIGDSVDRGRHVCPAGHQPLMIPAACNHLLMQLSH